MLRSLSSVLRASIIVVLLAAVVTYASVTRIMLYRNTTEIDLLKQRFDAYITVRGARDDGQDDRITALEKTVYVAPDPKEAARRPAALEQWIVNAATELRARVKALEEWRFRSQGKD